MSDDVVTTVHFWVQIPNPRDLVDRDEWSRVMAAAIAEDQERALDEVEMGRLASNLLDLVDVPRPDGFEARFITMPVLELGPMVIDMAAVAVEPDIDEVTAHRLLLGVEGEVDGGTLEHYDDETGTGTRLLLVRASAEIEDGEALETFANAYVTCVVRRLGSPVGDVDLVATMWPGPVDRVLGSVVPLQVLLAGDDVFGGEADG